MLPDYKKAQVFNHNILPQAYTHPSNKSPKEVTKAWRRNQQSRHDDIADFARATFNDPQYNLTIYNTIGGLPGPAALNPGRPPIVDQPVVSEPNPRGQGWCAMVCGVFTKGGCSSSIYYLSADSHQARFAYMLVRVRERCSTDTSAYDPSGCCSQPISTYSARR